MRPCSTPFGGSGVDPGRLRPEDLVAVEEFHIGGRQATAHLANVMGVAADTRLLDVGSGIGGAARYFALERGCDVVGIDLTEEFCTVADDFSARLGLSERTQFVVGSALDLPFEESSFDDACMLHVGMNIEDKARLLDEVARVLRPAGRFAVYDILAGNGEPHFPVPWAQDASTSFLVLPEELCTLMEGCGFEVVAREDRPEAGLAFFRDQAAAREAGTAPAVSVPILMGKDGPERLGNATRSLEEGRIKPWLVVGKKASKHRPRQGLWRVVQAAPSTRRRRDLPADCDGAGGIEGVGGWVEEPSASISLRTPRPSPVPFCQRRLGAISRPWWVP